MSRPCPNCGADVPDDTTFCPTCSGYVAWDADEDGEAEAESPRMPGETPPPPPDPPEAPEPPPSEPATIACPECGEDNPATRSLCQRCGTPLHAPAPAPPPPAPEPSGPRRGLVVGLGLLALLGVVVLGVVLLTGGDDDPGGTVASPTDDATVPSPTPSVPSPTPSPTEESPTPLVTVRSPEPTPAVTEAPFFANTEPDTEDAGGTGTLRAVVVSRGPGYDEVAFDVDGPGLGWLVEYVDDPRHQGSGEPVDVDGDTVLRIQLQSVEPPEDGGGPVDLQLEVTDAMVELVDGRWFEGQWEFFVGLDGPRRPFRMIPDDDGGGLLQVDTTGAG